MERKKYVNLPLAGNVQHGMRQENGVPTELRIFYGKNKGRANGFACKKV